MTPYDQELDGGATATATEPPAEPPPAESVGEDSPPAYTGRASRPRKDARAKDDDGYKPPPLTVPQIKVKLRQLINTTGGLVMLADPYDGQVILSNADAMADAYTELAKRHKSIRRAIEALETGGTYGAAISVTLAVALPILAHHNKLPGQFAPIAHMFGAEVSVPAEESAAA